MGKLGLLHDLHTFFSWDMKNIISYQHKEMKEIIKLVLFRTVSLNTSEMLIKCFVSLYKPYQE